MNSVTRYFFAACAAACLAGGAAAARFEFDATPGRLAKDVVPFHYRLDFDLDPQRDTFAGRAEIELRVRKPVPAIELQAVRLTARGAVLIDEGGAVRDLLAEADEAAGRLRLRWATRDLLVAGTYRLRIDYEGRVERAGQALFRVEYTAEGKPARMLATQMEPTHARAVFPAFDEPAFRATFDIAVAAPARYEAVSNMPASAQEELPDGRRRTRFARTPPMPTYLVALAVGEFDRLEDSFDGVPLRILTARGRSGEARYAMEATRQLLGYYRDYFGVPYMLPKLDQLAIPGVRGGAMEDWGAVSYNENLLLFDSRRSGPRQQAVIFSVVAHELAHQWFGDLVTAAWWDDIWLNEAFATWMAGRAVDHFNPAWKVRQRARLGREEVMARDAGDATRAVSDPPPHESAIFDVFDDITYDKGGAVLGMFEEHLGADVLRDGLRRYFDAHRYSNATADDLWFHLSRAAGRDVAPLVGAWIRQPGFPLLRMETACRDGRTVVDLSQQRFTASAAQPDDAWWPIPVVLRGGAQTRRLVLGRSAERIEFAGCVPVVGNAGDVGFYRVLSDAENSARLRDGYAAIPAVERLGLVGDGFALARAGRVGFADYFALLEVARAETEGAIWQQIIGHLQYLDETFAHTPIQADVRAYGRRLLVPVLARVGWQPRGSEGSDTLRLRDALIDALGRFEDEATLARSAELFAAAQADPPVPLDPSIRAAVVRNAARRADAATFDVLRRLLRDAPNQEDNYLYGGALIQVRDPVLVRKLLELTLTDEWPPGAAAWYAGHVGAASGQAESAREFVVRNFDALQAKASAWSRRWLLPNAYSGFSDAERARELVDEQRRALGDEALGPAEQVAVAMRERAAVQSRDGAALKRLLQQHGVRAAPGLSGAARTAG